MGENFPRERKNYSSGIVSERASPENLPKQRDDHGEYGWQKRQGVETKIRSGIKMNRPPLPSPSTSPPTGLCATAIEPIQGTSPRKLITSSQHQNLSHPTGIGIQP